MIHLVLLLNDVVFFIGCFVCGLSLGVLLIGALFGTLVRFSGIPRTAQVNSALNTLDRLVVRGICGIAVAMPIMMAEAWIIGRLAGTL